MLFPTRSGWDDVTVAEAGKLKEQINPVDGKHQVDSEQVVIKSSPLPFYAQVRIYAIFNPTWPRTDLIVYYLSDQGNLFRLNGTSPPIHEVNAKAPIDITEKNVLDYLRFFCFFVRGEDGPFYIFENTNDPYLSHEIFRERKKIIDPVLQPAALIHQSENGNYACTGLVWYSDALFFANFVIQPSGMIEVLYDLPTFADLNTRITAPIT